MISLFMPYTGHDDSIQFHYEYKCFLKTMLISQAFLWIYLMPIIKTHLNIRLDTKSKKSKKWKEWT